MRTLSFAFDYRVFSQTYVLSHRLKLLFSGQYNDTQQLKDFSRAVISTLNPGQDEAFRRSLQLPFTVINGGPQTGKSSIAAGLACMFVQRNKQTTKGQVLLCAPNITSMHNLAGEFYTQGSFVQSISSFMK